MVVAAPNWKGQYLPWGASGMPASHPQVFSFAQPKFIPGRGFTGLGVGPLPSRPRRRWQARRGLGQTSCSMTSLPQCSEGDIVAYNLIGSIGVSSACSQAQAACNAKTVATPPAPVALTPPSTPGVGVGVLCTSPAGVPNSTPCAAGQVPSAADYAAVAQAVSNAQVAAQQALNAGQVNPIACPYATAADGTCCDSGVALDANGNCATSFPWWGWAIVAAVGVIVLVKA
jgi:hypothetical protein